MGKHLGSNLSPPPTLEIFVINVVLYSLLGVFAISVSTRKDLQRLSSVPRFIVLAVILRVVWFASEYAGWGTAAGCYDAKGIVTFCGRLAGISQFLAFASILTFWWDILRADPDALLSAANQQAVDKSQQAQGTTGFSYYCQPKTIDIIIKFWLIVIFGGLFLYKMFTCDDNIRETVSDAEIEAIAFFSMILGIGFFVIGRGLRKRLSLRESVSSSQLQFRITIIAVVAVICFTLRSVLFLLSPMFGVRVKGYAREILYPWFFYTVPEIAPPFVVLLFMMKRKKFSLAMEDALLIAPTEHHASAENSLRIFRV